MNSICVRCALRLERAVRGDSRQSLRALSTTSTRRAAIPEFIETPSLELNETFSTIREKHFIPAYIPKAARRLIFEQKSRQTLQENPRTITVGEEDVELQWLDRTREIPNRRSLVFRVLKLMQEGEAGPGGETWRKNLPALLTGLHEMNPRHDMYNVIAHTMVRTGQLGTLIICLQQASRTGMSLRRTGVLDAVLWGLHREASREQWSEEALTTARKHARLVALLLEGDAHTPEKGAVVTRDHRSRPYVVATFLELEAAWALKAQDGQDVDGKVKMYTERLLDCLKDQETPSFKLVARGPQYSILHNVPVWHALWLAQRVLDSSAVPESERVEQILQTYEQHLSRLAEMMEQETANPTPSKRGYLRKTRYMEEAVDMWRNVIKG